MLGLEKGTVHLTAHDADWERKAAETITELYNILGDTAIEIAHVGSTSVPSIMAKPILDFAVGVRMLDDVMRFEEPLRAHGFVHRPTELTTQHLFAAGSAYDGTGNLQTHFVHIVVYGSTEWINYLRFRDTLRSDFELAKAYEALKLRLAAEQPVDEGRTHYTAGKHPFITHVLESAKAEARRRFTNDFMLQTAMRQSAVDCGCTADDFLREENLVTPFALRKGTKSFYKADLACNLVSFGNNVVATAQPLCEEAVRSYLQSHTFYHLFETPNLHILDEALTALGYRVCFMAEYFLPDCTALHERDCPYPLRVLYPEEFQRYYLPEWSNALCKHRAGLDRLCVGAFDGDRLIGLAGCSADCDEMWQIGVDVLPAYRRQGIASALTSRLALETIDRGKVPFYCAAWSNLRSVRNALNSGFLPSWVEMTAKPAEYVQECNKDKGEHT